MKLLLTDKLKVIWPSWSELKGSNVVIKYKIQVVLPLLSAR